ncbi:MAG: hypothetical protein V9E84_00785 [Trichococcus flocculiformis]
MELSLKGKGKRKEEIHRVQIAEGVINKREKKETEKSDICFFVEIRERCVGEGGDLFRESLRS